MLNSREYEICNHKYQNANNFFIRSEENDICSGHKLKNANKMPTTIGILLAFLSFLEFMIKTKSMLSC